jgi:hypothetical protein
MAIHSMDDLRKFVAETLCSFDQLQNDAFRLTETVLVRRNQPCGVCFCLHGPRAMKLTAVWDVLNRLVLFYGSSGARLRTTRLLMQPELA